MAEDEDANIISEVEKKKADPKKKELVITLNTQ